MPTEQFDALEATTAEQVWLVGTGISPPAVKFAASPEIAVRVGSASTRDTPACSKAFRVACNENPPEFTVPEGRCWAGRRRR